MNSSLFPIDILLVEDNPGDVLLVQEAVAETGLAYNIHVVRDGVEAMEYLRKEGKYADVLRPDLVLLDLNLPRKSGREVLAEIKSDENLRSIPVVILTASALEMDVVKAYHEYANCFIIKPINLDQFIKVAQAIQEFWFAMVKLPHRP